MVSCGVRVVSRDLGPSHQAGWYHTVLNLGPLTVAVSQNFVAPAALPRIWPTLQAREATFAAVLTDMLEHCRPNVAAALPARESAGCGKSAAHSQPGGCQRPNWHAGVESKEEGISLGVWWRPVEGGGGAEGSAAAAEGGGAEGGGGESARSVLFVSAAWLDGLLSRKPMAAQSVPADAARRVPTQSALSPLPPIYRCR